MSSSGPFRSGGVRASGSSRQPTESPHTPSPFSTSKKRKLGEHHEIEAQEVEDRFISQQHLTAVRAELDHERKMREIDQKRAKLVQDRLASELELARKASDDAASLLRTVQEEAERSSTDLRKEHQKAVDELQRFRIELQRLQKSSSSSLSDPSSLLKEKCRRLEEQVEAQADSEARMRSELEQMRESFQARLKELTDRSAAATSSSSAAAAVSAAEKAPMALMGELHRTRIKLAESERQVRQLQRKNESLDRQNRSLVRDQEEARSARARVATLERKVRDLQTKYEEANAQLSAWTEFGESLMRELGSPDGLEGSGGRGGGGAPPEVATILRHMYAAQLHAKDLKREDQRKDQRIEFLSTSLEETKQKLKQAREQVSSLSTARAELQKQADAHQLRNESAIAQKAILERELASLRELVKTFDGMPLLSPAMAASHPSDVLASPELQTSVKTLEVRLNSVQDELDLVRSDRDRVFRELEASQIEREANKRELAEVKDKFGRLREAWQAEKVKAAQAEERANTAEALAGKGSFNPEKVRALHLKETPLIESLREEVAVLKRQLEAKGEKSASKLSSTVDLEKATQRLKENFKGQISLFREGVYLMTGFRVELLPGTDRPTFRVRSVFAEREEDQLLFKWPKGDEVTSLDLLETDLAKDLADTPSYQYMVKFHSLPAFLASVQLSLFEKQTVMM
jgi:mitotic spindle assembly checkpoint protein MAD1